MNENELLNIWKSYDQKLEQVLSLNKEILTNINKDKLNRTIGPLRGIKKIMLLIGIPYTLLLFFISFIGYKVGALFVMFGFGSIATIMTGIIISYIHHIYLIQQIMHSEEIMDVQHKLSKLKISSFNVARLAVIQFPFWSICWMSIKALIDSPIVYGGINLIIFLLLSYVSYWLYKRLDIQNEDSKVSKLFFSGSEWEPLQKASGILEQIKEYQSEK